MRHYIKGSDKIDVDYLQAFIPGQMVLEFEDSDSRKKYIESIEADGYVEVFYVYEGFMYDLRKKVASIQKKCSKNGCEFQFEEIGETIQPVLTNEKDAYGHWISENCRFVICKASGTAKVNGWEFVASVEHTAAGNILNKALTDVEIPKRYRGSSCYCEHCNTKRARKDTYIVRNTETNEFKQIGKNCLMEFTNGLSTKYVAFAAQMREIFAELEDKPVSSSSYIEKHYRTEEVLRYAAETIRCFGYSKGEGETLSTKGLMSNIIGFKLGKVRSEEERRQMAETLERVGFDHESEKTHKTVETVLEWLKNHDDDTDYFSNLRVATSNEWCKERHFGIIVSLFPSYNRELERVEEKAKEAEASKHVGKVGDRITIEAEKIRCISSWKNSFGYNNYTYIWLITGDDGNAFTWKTSNWLNEEKKYTIKATVKDHTEFRGVKQTEIFRCKATLKADEEKVIESANVEIVPYDNGTEKALDEFLEYTA